MADNIFDAKAYWNKRLSAHYDLIGVGDISLTLNYNRWSYRVTRYLLKRLFKKYASHTSNKRVLDIGSGTGFVVDIWKNIDKEVTGIDISETAVLHLQQKFPEFEFIEADVGNGILSFEENYFNCCSAASVLYHIVDDNSFNLAIKNIHRILEKDGIFIFSDNFIHQGNVNITHQKCRTLEEYETILIQNNFQIVDRVPNYVLFNDPVDSNFRFYSKFWYWNTRLSKKSKLYDFIIWPLLYPLEILLTTTMKESPAQEFIICKAIK